MFRNLSLCCYYWWVIARPIFRTSFSLHPKCNSLEVDHMVVEAIVTEKINLLSTQKYHWIFIDVMVRYPAGNIYQMICAPYTYTEAVSQFKCLCLFIGTEFSIIFQNIFLDNCSNDTSRNIWTTLDWTIFHIAPEKIVC